MNQPLLVVLPYHAGDIELAKKLVQWIGELGSCKPHSLLLCADTAAPRDKIIEIMELARPHFVKVQTMLVAVPAPAEGKTVWPPNVMFLNAARQVNQCHKFDFLWLEPDAIPMYAGWLDDISEEYYEAPQRFMGSLIKQQGQEGLPAEYLNGVAVYPNNAIETFEKIATIKDGTQAFDIASAAVVVPRSANTPLVQHFWGTKELPPIFVESKTGDSAKNHVTLDFVRKDAAIFHRSKDGKLIDLLMARRKSSTLTQTVPLTEMEQLKKLDADGKTTLSPTLELSPQPEPSPKPQTGPSAIQPQPARPSPARRNA